MQAYPEFHSGIIRLSGKAKIPLLQILPDQVNYPHLSGFITILIKEYYKSELI